MSKSQLQTTNEKELLQLHGSIINELINRHVVRTQNSPIGDYTEWLVARALNISLENNSKSGYDGIDKNGLKIQIKGRRITSKNKSRQLSAIRNIRERDFDVLVAIIYSEDYDILEAWEIPHTVIVDYATYRKHQNAHILTLNGPILSDSRIRNIKPQIHDQQLE